MSPLTRREYFVLGAVILIFVSFLIPGLLYARREARDGLRRGEIAAFKNVLEQYYNQHGTYPLEFNAAPHRYVVVSRDAAGVTAWYLQAQLENAAPSHEGRNEEEGATFDYRVVREGGLTLYEVCGGTPDCSLQRRTIPQTPGG